MLKRVQKQMGVIKGEDDMPVLHTTTVLNVLICYPVGHTAAKLAWAWV